MPAAVKEDPEDTYIRLYRSAGYKVCDVSAIISMDVAVTGAAAMGQATIY